MRRLFSAAFGGRGIEVVVGGVEEARERATMDSHFFLRFLSSSS